MISAGRVFMSDVSNRTYITLDGYVQVHKHGHLYFVIMLAAYILIILFNSAIVFVIWTNKKLHEPMYVFIAALLVNSVLFSTVIYPTLLINFLSEKQIISYSICLLQCQHFYCFSCSEILLLAAMSYDRYVSICKPLRYQAIMRRTTVISLIVLAWLLPAVQIVGLIIQIARGKVCSFTLRGMFCNNAILNLFCVMSRAIFFYSFFIMFNVTLLPLSFILFTYTRNLLIAYRDSREVRKKVAETILPHLFVLMSFSFLFVFDAITTRVKDDLPQTAAFVVHFQLFLYHPLFNPIMYGLKMKEIHKHLKRMFLKKRKFLP